jgi:two-component system response regulator HydG
VFVAVNCAGLPETLLESELFGHVKGSFTGAYRDRPGKLEQVDGGTIFLDEVGEMSLRMQGLLLRFLETGEIQKVGSDAALRRVDARVIGATHRNLRELIALGLFREDLFYRLNVLHIEVPPLREHKEDIPLLVEHFLGAYCRKYGRPLKSVGPAALRKLEDYGWPGNVRELQHAVERSVIMSDADVLQPEDFLFSAVDGSLEDGAPAAGKLEDMERLFVDRILSKHGGNVSKAARELGISRAALYRRLEKHGL